MQASQNIPKYAENMREFLVFTKRCRQQWQKLPGFQTIMIRDSRRKLTWTQQQEESGGERVPEETTAREEHLILNENPDTQTKS